MSVLCLSDKKRGYDNILGAIGKTPLIWLVQNARAVYPPESTLDECMPSLTEGHALLIVESGRLVGILTKTDVLDYVAGKI